MNKSISLGHRLRYPITITKILKKRGDTVQKQEPLMQYSFKWMKTVGDPIRNNEWEEEQTTIVDWDSPADGEVREWKIKETQVITGDQVCLVIREPCSHEIQYQGLCAICGKDMTEVNWASEQRDTERAPINMTHDQTSLTVSELEATHAEQELQRRLLKQRKLSLVVDLDQTIIHACIEPTIGEWQSDPTNPNYESVKEVKSFQLNDDGPRGLALGCSYYIKMRPRLSDFLRKIAEMYELHVYTMGTRAYAKNIATLVDPDQKLFGNRVISRDENGSMTAKSLQRIFPVSTNMVVIIDDRADVWPRNRTNLIKVTPYDFFKGIGDINSSFLPKREDLLAQPSLPEVLPAPNGGAKSPSVDAPRNGPGATNGTPKVSALEELASMSSGDDATLRKIQTEEQEKTLEKQIKDRPLLHMQEKLDKEDEEAVKNTDSQSGEEPPSSPPTRHQLLLDDDQELSYLEEHLAALHRAYYEEYDVLSKRTPHAAIPDVGQVLDRLKSKVLQGTTIVLSGLVPLGADVLRSEIGLQATSFGAEIHARISKRVTHLVISSTRPRTQKVQQAAKIPSIKIVNQNWLSDSLSRWARQDEAPYLVEIHPADRAKGLAKGAASNETTDIDTVSDADSEDMAAPRRLKIDKPRLQIINETGQPVAEEDDDSDDEYDGPDHANDEGLLPDEPADGELSPVDGLKQFNWDDVDEEYKEFMADVTDEDEDEDDENQGEASGDDDDKVVDGSSKQSGTAGGRTKRKHVTDDEAGDTESDTSRGRSRRTESAIAKKLRVSRGRPSSGLREVVSQDDSGVAARSLPTPQITGDEDEVALLPLGDERAPVEEVEFDEDDLLAELEAEEDEEKG